MTRVGAIDCGTNSIRLLVADVDPGAGPGPRRWSTWCAGWRSSGSATGSTAPARSPPRPWPARWRWRATTPRSARSSRSSGSGSWRPRPPVTPATPREFVDGVRTAFAAYGIAPEVVTGHEEAALSFRGATGGLQAHGVDGPYLVVDLGGGSTEFVRGTDRRRAGPVGRHRLRPDDRAAPAQRPADRRRDRGRHRATSTPRSTRPAATVAARGCRDARGAGRLGHHHHRARAAACPPTTPRASTSPRCRSTRSSRPATSCWRMPRAERAALGFMHPGRVDVIGAGALVWRRIVERVSTARPASPRSSPPSTTSSTASPCRCLSRLRSWRGGPRLADRTPSIT